MPGADAEAGADEEAEAEVKTWYVLEADSWFAQDGSPAKRTPAGASLTTEATEHALATSSVAQRSVEVDACTVGTKSMPSSASPVPVEHLFSVLETNQDSTTTREITQSLQFPTSPGAPGALSSQGLPSPDMASALASTSLERVIQQNMTTPLQELLRTPPLSDILSPATSHARADSACDSPSPDSGAAAAAQMHMPVPMPPRTPRTAAGTRPVPNALAERRAVAAVARTTLPATAAVSTSSSAPIPTGRQRCETAKALAHMLVHDDEGDSGFARSSKAPITESEVVSETGLTKDARGIEVHSLQALAKADCGDSTCSISTASPTTQLVAQPVSLPAETPPAIAKFVDAVVAEEVESLGECLAICAQRSRTLKLLGFQHLHYDARLQNFLQARAPSVVRPILEMILLTKAIHAFQQAAHQSQLLRRLSIVRGRERTAKSEALAGCAERQQIALQRARAKAQDSHAREQASLLHLTLLCWSQSILVSSLEKASRKMETAHSSYSAAVRESTKRRWSASWQASSDGLLLWLCSIWREDTNGRLQKRKQQDAMLAVFAIERARVVANCFASWSINVEEQKVQKQQSAERVVRRQQRAVVVRHALAVSSRSATASLACFAAWQRETRQTLERQWLIKSLEDLQSSHLQHSLTAWREVVAIERRHRGDQLQEQEKAQVAKLKRRRFIEFISSSLDSKVQVYAVSLLSAWQQCARQAQRSLKRRQAAATQLRRQSDKDDRCILTFCWSAWGHAKELSLREKESKETRHLLTEAWKSSASTRLRSQQTLYRHLMHRSEERIRNLLGAWAMATKMSRDAKLHRSLAVRRLQRSLSNEKGVLAAHMFRAWSAIARHDTVEKEKVGRSKRRNLALMQRLIDGFVQLQLSELRSTTFSAWRRRFYEQRAENQLEVVAKRERDAREAAIRGLLKHRAFAAQMLASQLFRGWSRSIQAVRKEARRVAKVEDWVRRCAEDAERVLKVYAVMAWASATSRSRHERALGDSLRRLTDLTRKNDEAQQATQRNSRELVQATSVIACSKRSCVAMVNDLCTQKDMALVVVALRSWLASAGAEKRWSVVQATARRSAMENQVRVLAAIQGSRAVLRQACILGTWRDLARGARARKKCFRTAIAQVAHEVFASEAAIKIICICSWRAFAVEERSCKMASARCRVVESQVLQRGRLLADKLCRLREVTATSKALRAWHLILCLRAHVARDASRLVRCTTRHRCFILKLRNVICRLRCLDSWRRTVLAKQQGPSAIFGCGLGSFGDGQTKRPSSAQPTRLRPKCSCAEKKADIESTFALVSTVRMEPTLARPEEHRSRQVHAWIPPKQGGGEFVVCEKIPAVLLSSLQTSPETSQHWVAGLSSEHHALANRAAVDDFSYQSLLEQNRTEIRERSAGIGIRAAVPSVQQWGNLP